MRTADDVSGCAGCSSVSTVIVLPDTPHVPRSTASVSVSPEHRVDSFAYTQVVADLASPFRVGPLEIPVVVVESCNSATTALQARLNSPSISSVVLTRLPPRVHADRPLEVGLAAVGLGTGASAVVSIASWISAHARLTVEIEGQSLSIPVKARPSGSGWIIRTFARPSAWANAASVMVVSLSLAGSPLHCDCLPATLRVGYNHAPAPPGAVYNAVQVGDVAALRVALEAGGSAEEANLVR